MRSPIYRLGIMSLDLREVQVMSFNKPDQVTILFKQHDTPQKIGIDASSYERLRAAWELLTP